MAKETLYYIVKYTWQTKKFLMMENALSEDRWTNTEYNADRYPLNIAHNLYGLLKERYAGDLNLQIEKS